ncbi:unnamed protein product [Closterium sp. NIES-54]
MELELQAMTEREEAVVALQERALQIHPPPPPPSLWPLPMHAWQCSTQASMELELHAMTEREEAVVALQERTEEKRAGLEEELAQVQEEMQRVTRRKADMEADMRKRVAEAVQGEVRFESIQMAAAGAHRGEARGARGGAGAGAGGNAARGTAQGRHGGGHEEARDRVGAGGGAAACGTVQGRDGAGYEEARDKSGRDGGGYAEARDSGGEWEGVVPVGRGGLWGGGLRAVRRGGDEERCVLSQVKWVGEGVGGAAQLCSGPPLPLPPSSLPLLSGIGHRNSAGAREGAGRRSGAEIFCPLPLPFRSPPSPPPPPRLPPSSLPMLSGIGQGSSAGTGEEAGRAVLHSSAQAREKGLEERRRAAVAEERKLKARVLELKTEVARAGTHSSTSFKAVAQVAALRFQKERLLREKENLEKKLKEATGEGAGGAVAVAAVAAEASNESIQKLEQELAHTQEMLEAERSAAAEAVTQREAMRGEVEELRREVEALSARSKEEANGQQAEEQDPIASASEEELREQLQSALEQWDKTKNFSRLLQGQVFEQKKRIRELEGELKRSDAGPLKERLEKVEEEARALGQYVEQLERERAQVRRGEGGLGGAGVGEGKRGGARGEGRRGDRKRGRGKWEEGRWKRE